MPIVDHFQSLPTIPDTDWESFRRQQHDLLEAQLRSTFASRTHSPFRECQEIHRQMGESNQGNMEATSPERGPVFVHEQIAQGEHSVLPMRGRNVHHEAMPFPQQAMIPEPERRMSLQPDWNVSSQRPITPPDRACSSKRERMSLPRKSSLTYEGKLPLTPHGTPHTEGLGRFVNNPVQFSQQPAPMHHHHHFHQPVGFFQTSKGHPRNDPPPSPPNTTLYPTQRRFDVAPMPTAANLDDLPLIRLQPDNPDSCYDSSPFSRVSRDFSPVPSSSPTSPDMGYMASFEGSSFDCYMGNAMHQQLAHRGSDAEDFASPLHMGFTFREKTDFELAYNCTIVNTGVSQEQVQRYISQPDPSIQKWTCVFENCGKVHGRRENIKSHVQTHLGDRPFKCNRCDNDGFVRPNDMKRHAKIHKPEKDYHCKCGMKFARHDALTRHRQRNVCEGGFKGNTKPPVKRGRPRKDRPAGTVESSRVEKSRTRKQVVENSGVQSSSQTYASSISGASESSFMDSPPQPSPMKFESVDETTTTTRSSFEEMMAAPDDNFASIDDLAFSVAPEALSFTPSMSPKFLSGGSLHRSPEQTASTVFASSPPAAAAAMPYTIEHVQATRDMHATVATSSSQHGSPAESSDAPSPDVDFLEEMGSSIDFQMSTSDHPSFFDGSDKLDDLFGGALPDFTMFGTHNASSAFAEDLDF